MKKLLAVVVIIAMTVALGLTAFAETVYTDTEGGIIWEGSFWLSNDSETPAEHSGRTIDAVINASGAISELGVPNYWASNPATEGQTNAIAHVNVYKFDVNYAKTKQGTPVASAEIELAGDSNVGTTTEAAGTNCKVTANGNAGIMLKFETALPAGQYVVEFSQVAQVEMTHYLVLPMTQKEYPNDTVAYYRNGEKVDWFSYEGINPITLEKDGDRRSSSINELNSYYHVLEGDPTRLRDMAHRIIHEGASVEDFTESSDTSLMALGNKQSLVALRSQIDAAQKGVTVIKNYCNLMRCQMMHEIEKKLSKVQGVVEKMNREIKKLDYVIQTIETYAGIKEEVLTLISGEPAPETEPIVIRQAVLFMDEEFALIDDDFDWQKIGKFDDWLKKDGNFKTILPDAKSLVAIKPRRTEKKYSDNWWENVIMNRPNHVTLFLIRNGENLYRLESEHIYLKDRMFPNLDEYQKTLEEEQKDSFYEMHKKNDELKSDQMRRTFTKIAFLLQGLVDRSDVFAPHHVTCSFLKMEGLDDTIHM